MNLTRTVPEADTNIWSQSIFKYEIFYILWLNQEGGSLQQNYKLCQPSLTAMLLELN